MTAMAVYSRTEDITTATIPAQQVMTSAPRPRAIADLTLAATSTAVNVGLLFLRRTLTDWRHPELASSGEALLSEMLGEAVKLTGVPDPSVRWVGLDDLALVYVRLLLFGHVVVIEVIDRHREPPSPSDTFRLLSKRWNFCPVKSGRAVWCELELPQYEQAGHGLPKRKPSPVPRMQRRLTTPPVDQELLRRVRKGLEDL